MTLTIKLDGNWSSFQLANSAPPLSVTDSAIAPSARIKEEWCENCCPPGHINNGERKTFGYHHSDRLEPPSVIKSAAEAGMKILGAKAYHIIMVTLWVLVVKCKAQGNTKEAILCKYSRHTEYVFAGTHFPGKTRKGEWVAPMS